MAIPSAVPPTGKLGPVYLPGRPGAPVGRFEFIVDPDSGAAVEIGSCVAADTAEGTVIGAVVDMRTIGPGIPPQNEFKSSSWHPDRVGGDDDAMVAEVQVFASPRLRPVRGGAVRPATREEMRHATGMDRMSWPIPAGVIELLGDGTEPGGFAPVALDGVFVLGPEGQGIVTGGRSGLAAKSSFTTVFLRSAIHHGNDRDRRVAAVLFNVKGEDLLYLDRAPAAGMDLTDEDVAIYAAMGVPATPFPDVSVFGVGTLDGQACRSPREDARALRWDLPMAWRYLRFFFPDMFSDEKLAGFVAAFADVVMNAPGPGKVDTFDKLQTWFDDEIQNAEDNNNDYCFGGRTHVQTMRRIRRQILGLRARGEGLFCPGRANPADDIPVSGWQHGQVVVVDLAGLSVEVKGFVIARTIDRLMRAAEHGELGVDSIVIGVDEANEYAPAVGSEMAVVRRSVQKVATQGRYAGCSLMVSAQLASKIDETLRDNCATRAVGNSPEGELTGGTYGRLSSGLVERIATMGKGQMAIWHAAFRTAVVVRFPRPAWQMGKNRTSAGSRPTVGSVLAQHLSPNAVARLTEGLSGDDVERIGAAAGSVDAAVAALAQARTPDMTRSAVHAPRRVNAADPYNLDDE